MNPSGEQAAMSDEMYPGGPVMIRIDGAKVRRIREQKGFTQLYIATAVEVTTDTVSRWENKRYPSIKQENGTRLAEALEVSLEEILETPPEIAPDESTPARTEPENQTIDSTSPPATTAPGRRASRISIKTALLLALMVAPLFAVSFYFLFFQENPPLSQITVSRTVSPHFIAGQPLPVFIHFSGSADQPISFILRENLPPGTRVLSTAPEISDKHKKNKSIQWLGTISSPTLFLYTIATPETFNGTVLLNGMLKINASKPIEIDISGDQSSTAGLHHWADKDRDNRISDEEILTIYDLADASHYAAMEMDLLEEIWLGDGYLWQPDKQQFLIRE